MRYGTSIVEMWAKEIACKLWPLKLTEQGGKDDRLGIDAYLYGESVQIKGDRETINSDKIYHEIYSKIKGHPEESWKCSPQNARYYIFVAHDKVLMTTLDVLANFESGRKLQELIDKDTGHITSMGYLLPRFLFENNDGHFGTFKETPLEYRRFKSRQEKLL